LKILLEEIMEYRKATINDINELTILRVKMLCENNNYSKIFIKEIEVNTRDYFLKEFANGNYISWIALDKNIIVAMVGISLFRIPPNDWCINGKTAYIGNMYTEIKYRKQGIAKVIFDKIMKESKEKGCERILLNTTDMGKKIYETYGFEISPTAMAYYPFGIACEKYKEKK
jgi:predicted acetyltransferase